MKNKKALLLLTLLGGLSLSAHADSDVNIWNWSDYIGENTIDDFGKKSGLANPNYAVFDSNEMVEARLLSGHSGFDAVMMTSYYVPRLAKAGALQKIDHAKIPHWSGLDQVRMQKLAEVDPGNEYAYPYTEISVGIGYNTKKIKEIFGEDYKVDSWDFLFDKKNSDKLRRCGIAVLDSPIEIISAAMHFLGKDPTSEERNDYREAQKLLTDLARNVSYFHSSRYINDLASGEICAAIIELKPEYTDTTVEDINEYCLDLPRYKRPRKIIFADVPRNPTGKIEKPVLRQRYGAEQLVDRENHA